MPSRDSTIDPDEEAWNRGREETRERQDRESHALFEERAVRHVLKGCGLTSTASQLADQAEELTGDRTISFAMFNHLVPDFPLRLGVAKLYYLDRTLTIEGLFRKPAQNQVYRAFHEWVEEDVTDDDRHRGIIFRLPGCPGIGSRAVLHTYPIPFEGEQTRITFGIRAHRGEPPVLYTLEPLDQLLAVLTRARDDYA
jgi:hypothetical protein